MTCNMKKKVNKIDAFFFFWRDQIDLSGIQKSTQEHRDTAPSTMVRSLSLMSLHTAQQSSGALLCRLQCCINKLKSVQTKCCICHLTVFLKWHLKISSWSEFKCGKCPEEKLCQNKRLSFQLFKPPQQKYSYICEIKICCWNKVRLKENRFHLNCF